MPRTLAELGTSHLTVDGITTFCGQQFHGDLAHLPGPYDERCRECWRQWREEMEVYRDDANLEAAE